MAYKIFQSEDGMWGVQDGAVLYDPSFSKITAQAIADLSNAQFPPKNWEETTERLDAMGLPYFK